MKHFKTITDLHRSNGFPASENPMISLLTCDPVLACSFGDMEFTGDFYMIGFKKLKSGIIRYGRTVYDHDHGSMSFIKPRQIVEIKEIALEEKGFLIFIHEDFLNGHALHHDIKRFGFFEYESHEALHLSQREEQIIWELYHKIETEYKNNQDEYTKGIVLGHIDSILKYAQRFYKRQFINRSEPSGKIVSKFNELLGSHFEDGTLRDKGLPTVADMAEALNVSPRYLSDLLKQETGKTAIEHIHIFLMSEAKNMLTGAEQSVAEIAYALGFENPPYFSRLFKKEVGLSPVEYKKQLLTHS